MAQPIFLEIPARDPRAELQARLQDAPAEHAEALLSAYEVLQGLHDRGVLDMLRGGLGSSDKVLEIIVDAAKTPESIRGMRNIIIMARLVGTIDPAVVEGFVAALPQAVAATKAHDGKTPGLWNLLKSFTSKDSRRGLLFATSLLEAVGRNLATEKPKLPG